MWLQGSESAGDTGASSTAVIDLEIKMEDLRQALRKAQVLFSWKTSLAQYFDFRFLCMNNNLEHFLCVRSLLAVQQNYNGVIESVFSSAVMR